jgi:type II secretion system protein C
MMQAHEILFNQLGRFMKLPFKGILLTLGCSFVLALTASFFMYRLVLPNVAQEFSREQQGAVFLLKESPTLRPNDVKGIVGRNIFNKIGEIPKEDMRDEKAAYKGAEAIKSELPLILRGLIYTGDVKSGLAFIENTEIKKQNSFLVGDHVSKDAVLLEVQERKVILQVGDHKEFLDMPDTIVQRGKRIRKKGGALGTSLGGTSSGKFSEEGFERDGNKISMSADYRQKLLTSDFAKVLQDAKAEPVYEGGELNGFKLVRIRSDSVYEKGGLQNDDIVKEINGVSLVDTAQAIKLLNSLRGASDIEIGINRGGKKLNVNIQVK